MEQVSLEDDGLESLDGMLNNSDLNARNQYSSPDMRLRGARSVSCGASSRRYGKLYNYVIFRMYVCTI